MPRYNHWESNEYARLNMLQQTPLFNDRLLPDIRKGKVFVAIRKSKIDFYHVGRKLFSFDDRGFRSNIAYLDAYKNKPNGEVSESAFKDLELCDSFYEGYPQIQKNTKLHIGRESEQVSEIWKRHSCCRNGADPFIVLDIELSLKAQDEGRTADQIDLILFDRDSQEIRFFEVKRFGNREIHLVQGHVAVVDQIGRYAKQVKTKHKSLLTGYKQYVRILNKLCGGDIPTPKSIDHRVDLLVFGFNSEERKRLKKIIIPEFSRRFHCSYRGKANGASQETLASWWRREQKQ